jgi:hypothetical protein
LGGADVLNAYLQTVDWLQGANNGGSLFIKGLADICTGWPSGATLLTRAKEEGDLQVSYVMFVLKYYKHRVTDDFFNHIQRFYGEDGDYYKDDACVMGVCHRVSEEIQMLEDGHTCLWKQGCGQWCTPMLCSLRCRIRAELYEFLIRFPRIIVVMDEIDM